MTINLSKHAGGGTSLYIPGMMEGDGVNGSALTLTGATTAGNKISTKILFNIPSFTGNKSSYMLIVYRSTDSINVMQILAYSSDFSDATKAGTIRILSQNTAATVIALMHSYDGYLDGNDHFLEFSFDADTGVASFLIDGQNADDTAHAARVAPTTGTLATGATTNFTFLGHTTQALAGKMGFFGFDDSYVTNSEAFFDPDALRCKELDEITWDEWGSQPLIWNANGYMEDNKGSLGNFTLSGGITPAFRNTFSFPLLGLPTIGDATENDIITDKIAWVDGARIVGVNPGGPSGILLYHLFDGAAGSFDNTKPLYCYDNETVFVTGAQPGWKLDGLGYAVESASGGRTISIDPGGRWPSRAGKTRHYKLWGQVLRTLTVNTDYPLWFFFNYDSPSNSYRYARLNCWPNYYNMRQMQHEVLNGVAATAKYSTANYNVPSPPYILEFHLTDFGSGDALYSTTQKAIGAGTDAITQQQAIHYSASGGWPHEDAQRILWQTAGSFQQVKWRGIMVWDD